MTDNSWSLNPINIVLNYFSVNHKKIILISNDSIKKHLEENQIKLYNKSKERNEVLKKEDGDDEEAEKINRSIKKLININSDHTVKLDSLNIKINYMQDQQNEQFKEINQQLNEIKQSLLLKDIKQITINNDNDNNKKQQLNNQSDTENKSISINNNEEIIKSINVFTEIVVKQQQSTKNDIECSKAMTNELSNEIQHSNKQINELSNQMDSMKQSIANLSQQVVELLSISKQINMLNHINSWEKDSSINNNIKSEPLVEAYKTLNK